MAEKKSVLPKDLPAYGATQPVLAPRLTQLKLENGLEVWLAPQPGFPKIAFVAAARGGYDIDPQDRPGIADLLATVVSQGTTTRSARQIAEELQAAGGDLNANASADSIFLRTSVLSGKVDAGLRIFCDVLQNSAFLDQEVEIAKNNALSTLEAQEAEPGFLAKRALYANLFKGHPYSITSPTRDSIAKSSAADLRQEYARRFRPDRMIFVAVGDFEPASFTAAIRGSLGSWKAAGSSPLPSVPQPQASGARSVVYVPREKSVQTTILMGALGPTLADPDYASAAVANAIFGGMFGSRLVLNIREDKGYTYSPGAQILTLREAGTLKTFADVRNAVTGASFNEINYELNRMATTAPEKDEVESAKRFLAGELAVELQSRGEVARFLAKLWIAGLPPEHIDTMSRKIESTTPGDVEAVSRRYFPSKRATVVMVGDQKVIEEQLAPFGVVLQRAQ